MISLIVHFILFLFWFPAYPYLLPFGIAVYSRLCVWGYRVGWGVCGGVWVLGCMCICLLLVCYYHCGLFRSQHPFFVLFFVLSLQVNRELFFFSGGMQ